MQARWPAKALLGAPALEAFQAGHAGSIPVARSADEPGFFELFRVPLVAGLGHLRARYG
jgi:hypothetical protein